MTASFLRWREREKAILHADTLAAAIPETQHCFDVAMVGYNVASPAAQPAGKHVKMPAERSTAAQTVTARHRLFRSDQAR
jgi:hypothetical protein